MRGDVVFVITADQKASRSHPDAVPTLLTRMSATGSGPSPGSGRLLLPFERTAGDEVQALADQAGPVVEAVTELLRHGQWWVGVGLGSVETPLPPSARAGRGGAYVAARAAVEAAKSAPTGVSIRGAGSAGPAAARAESAAWLLAALLSRRTPQGWEVVDQLIGLGPDARQLDVATTLGISPQAVSSRLRVAGWTEEQRGRELLTWLLDAAG
jgi:hypothetical protein